MANPRFVGYRSSVPIATENRNAMWGYITASVLRLRIFQSRGNVRTKDVCTNWHWRGDAALAHAMNHLAVSQCIE